MNKTRFDLDEFLGVYRELLQRLVELGDRWPQARGALDDLLQWPLDLPPTLDALPGVGPLAARVAELAKGARAMPEVEFAQLLRALIREVRESGAPRSANGGSKPAASPDKPARRVRGGSHPAAAAPPPPPSAPAPAPPMADAPEEGSRPHFVRRKLPDAPTPTGSIGGDEGEGSSYDESGGGLLSGSPPASAPPWDEPDTPRAPEPPETRYMNAAIAGRTGGAPLAVATDYLLEIWVALEKAVNAAAIPIPGAPFTHRPDEDVITLTIQVTSEDFVVAQDALPLKLPRRGPSAGRARFDITPKHDGEGTLAVSVYKEGNFLLQMELSYPVGAVAARESSPKVIGRPLSSAADLQPRDLTLIIMPGEGGFQCIVNGAMTGKVTLPLTVFQVADIVTAARAAMMRVVTLRNDVRALVFQTGIDIDAASEAKALRILAEAGATLFQRIFFGPGAGADAQKLGGMIRTLATKPDRRYAFQFMVDGFPVPWGMLYLGPAAEDDTLDWDLFLGMRHVVEQIPLKAPTRYEKLTIASDSPALAVSVNFNTSIDAQYKLDVVARQRAYWRDVAKKAGNRMTLVEGLTRKDILSAFRKPSADQLTYLYCHAETVNPGGNGGVQASSFVFANEERLTLAEMNLNAPTTDALPGSPLVFINACESAEMRPEFYDGFIPYFMEKGARGVVGTECETPAIFATEFALRFFPRFLDGEPLGELFLDLRRAFRADHRNPLGLLYNVYCDGDTHVRPGLTLDQGG
jgi:hypothetical protein